MADSPHRREDLLALREEGRRALRRRRRLAAGAIAIGLALAIVAASVLIGLLAGDSDGGGPTSSRSQGKSAHSSPSPVASSGAQADWTPHTGPVPIIEYHVLGSAPADAPYPELYVTRPDFRRQMDWLERRGFEAVTLEQVERAWYGSGTLPPKPIVISFDDGYRPQFTYALPELRRHGWAGVLNLKAEGSDLYSSNVEAMIAAGWELASHTIDHSDLTTISGADLEREVAGSRRILQRDYGVPVRNFCHPAGEYPEAVIAAVEAARYTAATAEIP